MDYRTWATAERGRAKAISEHFGITESAASQWMNNGVPVRHMPAVEAFTGGAVTMAEMVLERNALANAEAA